MLSNNIRYAISNILADANGKCQDWRKIMDFESVKEWLDLNISIRKQLAESQELNNHVSLCTINRENTMHVFEGIELIADTLGIELLQKETWKDEEHPYYYYFMYEGFEVFQLSRERLVQ